jgi:hypothetical protein
MWFSTFLCPLEQSLKGFDAYEHRSQGILKLMCNSTAPKTCVPVHSDDVCSLVKLIDLGTGVFKVAGLRLVFSLTLDG